MKAFFNKTLILLIGLSCGNSFSQELRSVREWETKFMKVWDKNDRIAIKQSESGDSREYYNLALYIDGNIAMFQASGDLKYLDKAFVYINNMIDDAKPSSSLEQSQFKDDFLGWSNKNKNLSKHIGKEVPLYESYCWRYVSYLLRVLRDSPTILSVEKYRNQYNEILEFTEKNIFQKWMKRGKSNIYRSNTHMFSHWARISLDLWYITGKEEYSRVCMDFNDKMKEKLVAIISNDKEVYSWKANWNEIGTGIQDVSHGNAVIGTIIEMYELGAAYNAKDINTLSYVFENVIWKGKKEFALNVDGSGKGTGWFSDGWIKLGRYDTSLQKRIEDHNRGRTVQFFGNGALNASIILHGKPVYPKI